MVNLELIFDELILKADFFEGSFTERLLEKLPLTTDLTAWGNELYGEVPVSIKEETLVEEVPPGGLAYTSQGDLLCVFFGQKPAWPVELVGQIKGRTWVLLRTPEGFKQLTIRRPRQG